MMNMFNSHVYHLYHHHKTPRTKDGASIISKKHRTLTKQEWVDKLLTSYDWGSPNNINSEIDPVNNTLLYAFSNMNTPVITLCIVSYHRYNTLISTLEKYKSFNIPLNVILWVNDSDDMTDDIRSDIIKIGDSFTSFDMMCSKKNMYTGYPRFIMLNRAHFEYNTPYIMTTDDDIMFENVESFIMGATILHQQHFKDYGAVGIWCEPWYAISKVKDGILTNNNTLKGFGDVDALGAATMTIRSDIISVCNTDPLYKIGWVDTDFSFQIVENGYKLGLLCDDRYKPLNIQDECDSEYKKDRSDPQIIRNSTDRFIKKWGIRPR